MRGERGAIVLCLALFAVLLAAFVAGWVSAPPSPQERLTGTAGVEMFGAPFSGGSVKIMKLTIFCVQAPKITFPIVSYHVRKIESSFPIPL